MQSPSSLFKALFSSATGPRPLDAISLLLALLTALLMVWHDLGMTRSLILEPGREQGVRVEDDSMWDGGSSSATLDTGDAFTMHCRLRGNADFDYPYCNLILSLSNNTQQGIDLTDYTQMRITMRHTSSEPEDVRIYLNHLLSEDVNPEFPFKMNMHNLEVADGLNTYTVSLDDFYVPFWWVCQSQANNGEPQLTNVREIIVSTGESNTEREVRIDVHRVEFRGKLISSQSLYQAMLYGWILWIVTMLLVRAYNLKRLSARLKARSARLQQANRHLGAKAREFKQAAATDELTGLLNRHGLNHLYHKAINNLIEDDIPFSVILLDIDYFKSINDRYGHDVGDDVLRAFARILNERCRQSDIPGRWGGEEFVIICPDTDLEGAVKLAHSIRTQIEQYNFGVEPLTCSLGVAQAEKHSAEDTIKRADIALYTAKGAGRNRVETDRP